MEIIIAIGAVVFCAWLVVRSERRASKHLHDFFRRD
jgi:hypothetical protein